MAENLIQHPHHRHHLHSPWNRAFYCLVLIIAVLGFGTWGMHHIEKFSYMDAFYFTSMLATGQGPPPAIEPVTSAGKLFACLMAFISIGTMIASLGFLFGPFLGGLWHLGMLKLEEEIEQIRRGKKK